MIILPRTYATVPFYFIISETVIQTVSILNKTDCLKFYFLLSDKYLKIRYV